MAISPETEESLREVSKVYIQYLFARDPNNKVGSKDIDIIKQMYEKKLGEFAKEYNGLNEGEKEAILKKMEEAVYAGKNNPLPQEVTANRAKLLSDLKAASKKQSETQKAPLTSTATDLPPESPTSPKRKMLEEFTVEEINAEMSKINEWFAAEEKKDPSQKVAMQTQYNERRLAALKSELEKREQAKTQSPQTPQTSTLFTVQPPDPQAKLKESVLKDKEALEKDDKKDPEKTKKLEDNLKQSRANLKVNPEAPGKHLRGLQEGREKAKEMIEAGFDSAAKQDGPYAQLAAYIVALFAAIFAGLGMLGNKGLEKLLEQHFKTIQPHLNNLEKLIKQKANLEEKIAKLKDDEPLTPREQDKLKDLEAKLKKCEAGIEAHKSLIERMASQKEAKAVKKIDDAQAKIDEAEEIKASSKAMLDYCDTEKVELEAQLEEAKDNPEKQQEIKKQLAEIDETRKEAEKTIKEKDKIILDATKERDDAKKDKDQSAAIKSGVESSGATGPGGVSLGESGPDQTKGSTSVLTTGQTVTPNPEPTQTAQGKPVPKDGSALALFSTSLGERVVQTQEVISVQSRTQPDDHNQDEVDDDLKEKKKEKKKETETPDPETETLDDQEETVDEKSLIKLQDKQAISYTYTGNTEETKAAKEATLAEITTRMAEKVDGQRPQLDGPSYGIYSGLKDEAVKKAIGIINDSKLADDKSKIKMRRQLQFLVRGARQEVMDLKASDPTNKAAIEAATRKMLVLEKTQQLFSTMKSFNDNGQKMSENQYKVHLAKIEAIFRKDPEMKDPTFGELKQALNKIQKANVYEAPYTRMGKINAALERKSAAIEAKFSLKRVNVTSKDGGANVNINLSYNRALVAGTKKGNIFKSELKLRGPKDTTTRTDARAHMRSQISDGLTIAMNQYGKGSLKNPISITYIPPQRPQPEAALALLMELKERAIKNGQEIHLKHPQSGEAMVITPQLTLSDAEKSCFNHFAQQKPIVGAKMGKECAGIIMFDKVRGEDGKKMVGKEAKDGEFDFGPAIEAKLAKTMKNIDKLVAKSTEKSAVELDKETSKGISLRQ